MPQLSEVATIGASLVNPYASQSDSIESRAWLLWRAAIGTAQRSGQAIGKREHFGADGLIFSTSLRKVARDLFGGVPGDLAAVYAHLKEGQNAVCIDRGGREVTPLWWFRQEFSVDGPTAEVTQLPVEAPEPVAKAKPKGRKHVIKSRTGFSMTQADQRAVILKALTAAEHPATLLELSTATKLHPTTVRVRLNELIADERAFRRLETLDERDGNPGRRHYLYWASPVIPVRPAELFKVSQPGTKPGKPGPRKSVLERVEALKPGEVVSVYRANRETQKAVQELIDGDVLEYVNATKREVRLAGAAPRTGLENGPKSQMIDGVPFAGEAKVTSISAFLHNGLETLITAEVDRRVQVRLADEVAELERRLAESEGARVSAQTELGRFKDQARRLLAD